MDKPQENTIDLQQVKHKIYERLIPSGWGDKLKTFILSQDFDRVLERLLADSTSGKKFTPKISQLFRAFEECPYDQLKVVSIGQDVYYQLGVADGIAFSCSNTGQIQASLEHIYNEIEKTVYPGEAYERTADLKRWSNQGVLLINTAFTTTVGKPGAHYDVWNPFLMFLLDILVWEKPGLIYAFFGKKAQELMELIPDNNAKLKVSHPASASYQKIEWDGEKIFARINEYSKRMFGKEINW